MMRDSKKKSMLRPVAASNLAEKIDWEMRPGGMLVQRRDENADDVDVSGPLIRLKVSHGSVYHEINISPHATFGDLKKLLVQSTGLQAREQRILYRGKERDSCDFLHLVGVKDKAKVVLIEDPESRERKQEESRHMEKITKSLNAIGVVKSEVDKLAELILSIESDVHKRIEIPESEFEKLTEKLMMQLLKLDGIEAFGDAKLKRRVQVRRVQRFVEALDGLKEKNATPLDSRRERSKSKSKSKSAIVTTEWETFDGGLLSPPRNEVATIAIEKDWERALFV